MFRFLIVPLLLLSFGIFAQMAPKREFRAVWVATVNNIDWPSKPGLTTDQQKKEVIDILICIQKMG